MDGGDSCPDQLLKVLVLVRPQRWSIFQGDGMVNVFLQATIDFNALWVKSHRKGEIKNFAK